ncbi:glycosyltransferase [Pelagicoccus enzymogenes]|uniref:glycosyltransferase n=1 Tax=Pelagicoccus enzymogenes TaxID=2773457 RepID=UPI00280E8A14|nr:glycosyltransferase [Pelagicoccus enzymogenes]MDQ8199160.1 glycosyltransferase [Pelagicoccus enzymogenes]
MIRKDRILLLTAKGVGSYSIVSEYYRKLLESLGFSVDELFLGRGETIGEGHLPHDDYAFVVHHLLGGNWSPLPRFFNVAVPVHEWSRYPRAWVGQLSKFDAIWAVSEFVSETLARSGLGVPVFPVKPPLDLEEIAMKEAWVAEKPFRYYSVGEPHFRKGWHLLLEAYLLAFPDDSEARLTIKTSEACDWESPRSDIEIVKECYSRPQLLGRYSDFDAYVSASLGEGLGLPVAEAVRAGLPVIVNDWGGHRSLLRRGCFEEIAHEEVDQLFCSVPDFFAPEQKCGYSSPRQIADALLDCKRSYAARDWKLLSVEARDHLLSVYGLVAAQEALGSFLRRSGISAPI